MKKARKRVKVVNKSKEIAVKNDNDSETEFMPSQDLRTFNGNPIVNGQKEHNCCTHGKKVTANVAAMCDLVCQITSKKYKKVKLSIEIENDCD